MVTARGIVVLVPVLNRPHRVLPFLESLYASTEEPPGVLFLCSPGDDLEIETIQQTSEDLMVVPWLPGNGDYAKKINLGFRRTEEPFVFTAADDLEFEYGWAEAALAVAERTACGVIGTNDDANPLVKRGKHSTHSLVRRHYVERWGATWHDGPGVLLHEGYEHQWVDTELVAVAVERGQWAFSNRSVVRHLHPMFAKNVAMDDTYRKALGGASHDKGLFLERQALAKPRRGR